MSGPDFADIPKCVKDSDGLVVLAKRLGLTRNNLRAYVDDHWLQHIGKRGKALDMTNSRLAVQVYFLHGSLGDDACEELLNGVAHAVSNG